MGPYEVRAALRRGSGLWIEVDPARVRWTAAARLIDQGGALALAEFRVFSRPGDLEDRNRPLGEPERGRAIFRGGITTRILRGIPLGLFVKAGESYLRRITREEPLVMDKAGLAVERRRRGRIPDTLLLRTVQAYARARERGNGRRIHAMVAQELDLTLGRVRDLIFTARKRGLMTPALAQGKAGGDLTLKGRALLRRLHRAAS